MLHTVVRNAGQDCLTSSRPPAGLPNRLPTMTGPVCTFTAVLGYIFSRLGLSLWEACWMMMVMMMITTGVGL